MRYGLVAKYNLVPNGIIGCFDVMSSVVFMSSFATWVAFALEGREQSEDSRDLSLV